MVQCRFYKTCENYSEYKSICDSKSNLVKCSYYKGFRDFIKSMRVKTSRGILNEL